MAKTATKPPDRYGRPWGDPNYGADAPAKKKRQPQQQQPTSSPQPPPPAPAPSPAGNPYEEERRRNEEEYAQQQAFAEEERNRQGQFDQADYDRQMALLQEERNRQGQFDQADYDRQMPLLQEQQQQERQFLDQEYQRQKQYIEQDAALSEQERQLQLQALETRLRFDQQQIALRQQQIISDRQEEFRQAPLRLRDIADEFASQGAFYSGKRQFTQDEAQHASTLTIQGFDRALKGETLNAQEQEAMAAIQRGQFGIDAQRIALEMGTQLAALSTDYARSQWDIDFNYRSQTGDLTSDLERSKWEQDFGYRRNVVELKDAYEANKRRLEEAVKGGAEGKQLTKADLGTMLRQGLIDKNQYKEALVAQGYTEDQAKLMYLSEKAKGPMGGSGGKQISQSQLETMFRQGLMSKASYIKNLKGLGYSKEQAAALAASAEKKGPTGKMITKEDITTSYALGVMSRDTAYKTLRALGYDDYSAQAILANAQVKKGQAAQRDSEAAARKRAASARDAQGRSLTKADWTSLYRNGGISRPELIQGLMSIDYSQAEAEAIAYNADKAKSSSSTSDSGYVKLSDGTVISEAKGKAIQDQNTYIAQNKQSYQYYYGSVYNYLEGGGTRNLKAYVQWAMTQFYEANKAANPKWSAKQLTSVTQQEFSKYSRTISLAWWNIYGSRH